MVLPDRVLPRGAILVKDGKILFAGAADDVPALPAGCERRDATGLRACPALWEVHIHGCGGYSTEHLTAESLAAMAAFLAGQGVGAFQPTVVAQEETLSSLGEALDSAGPSARGRALGIHVEGPFVASRRRGAIPPQLLRPPSVDYLDRMIELSRRHIRTLTIAPELEGAADLISRLPGLGIIPSLGHSDSSFEVLDGMDKPEPLSVTHLFNGMSGVSHKTPGLAQWALLDPRVYTELNADGTHVHDAAVRLALHARPPDRLIAISDAIAPAGLPAGHPPGRLYGRALKARGSGLFYEDSDVLVGSRFLVRDEVARLVSHFHVPVAEAVAMATRNPARLLGFERKGALLAGFDADVALFTEDFSRCVAMMWDGVFLHDGPR